MEKSKSCPMDGSWLQNSCTIYMDHKESVTLAGCEYRSGCRAAREDVELNANESVAIVKKVLVEGIPNIFKK